MESFKEHYENSLNEGTFSQDKIEKVVKLMGSIIGKTFGGKFYSLGKEKFKSKVNGQGIGVRMMNNQGYQIRFNWSKTIKSKFLITSLDYWSNDNMDFAKPTLSIKFGSDTNVVQVMDKVSKVLKKGRPGKSINENFEVYDSVEEASREEKAAERKRREQWLTDNDLPASYGYSEVNTRKKAEKAGKLAEYEAFMGQKEENEFQAKIDAVQKLYDENIYADPDTIFEDVEALVGVVAAGLQPALVIAGAPGIGKTYGVKQTLKSALGTEGKAYKYFKGIKGSASSLYLTLFQNRDRLIVLDDSDGVLSDDDAVNMLKAALDSDPDGRKVSASPNSTIVTNTEGLNKNQYQTFMIELQDYLDQYPSKIGRGKGQLPSSFEFTGQMIFISNKNAKFWSEVGGGAIMSRSLFMDIHLAESDIQKRIKSIAIINSKEDNVTKDEIDEIMEALGAKDEDPVHKYMTPEIARETKELTIRSYQIGLSIKKAGIPDWKRLVGLYA